MADVYLFNSLTRKKEKFVAINPPNVGMYTCGPTVYDFAQIGNWRTYTTADILVRTLQYNGYKVNYIMNLTDVGHLTGDNSGDSSTGEDRMEKAAKRENKTAWDIAKFYTEAFYKDFEKMNLLKPKAFTKATDHIKEQIDLVQILEKKGFAYKTKDGLYFDTVKYEKDTGNIYGDLSTMKDILEGARVEPNPEKKNPRDFALWKFSEKPGDRHMEWKSPWGIGFPGWHIECSAMSMKYLGESFDIHAGGEDLIQTHHPNEIAQSEAATGKKFVNFWVHSIFLKVDGKRMGKSVGNAYTVTDVEKKGFEPLALRYLYLTAHYRDTLNFTWTSLDASQTALNNLRSLYRAARGEDDRKVLSPEKALREEDFRNAFLDSINDDLNTPKALAVAWEVAKSSLPSNDKHDLLTRFDEVLGLDLGKAADVVKITKEIKNLIAEREKMRVSGNFIEADKIRAKLLELGIKTQDSPGGNGKK